MDTRLAIVIFSFIIVSLASKQFGDFFRKARLPLITGFLFTGMAVGPSISGLVNEADVSRLRFIDNVSLAVIAFAAGGELHLKELRSRISSIAWTTIGLIVITFTLGSSAVFLLANHIPFLKELPTAARIAVALLAGVILVARSPSSAIAVVNELKARGPFTQTALGVTVIMDVAVIVLFAVNYSVANTLVNPEATFNITFLGLLAAELATSVVLGWLLGKLVALVLGAGIYRFAKIGSVLLIGYGVFVAAEFIKSYTEQAYGHAFYLEPLLICMIGGFSVANFSECRNEFNRVLKEVGPPVYVAFFTLTGASLDLGVLRETWTIAVVLFAVRLTGIFAGSFFGGLIAGESMRNNRLAWMSYITQAGVGLGLAKQVAASYPPDHPVNNWGLEFATTIIAVIILNQIVGPPFFKWVLNLVNEAHDKDDEEELGLDEGARGAIIFGLGNRAYVLALELSRNGWQTMVVTRKRDWVESEPDPEGLILAVDDFEPKTLEELGVDQADSIVLMLSDEESYEVGKHVKALCKANLVARVSDPENIARFEELGALVVEPTSATINLLDHFVRAPVATSILLGRSSHQEMRGIGMRNRSLVGSFIHDLKIPFDVIVLSIKRGDQVLSSVSYVELEHGDWLTCVGPHESLDQVAKLFRAPSRYLRLADEQPPKVLLVDDEEDFVETLAARLETRNFEPAIESDGERAVAAIDAEEPDVIVVDLQMPGLDGLEVLETVRKSNKRTEVIILTGHGTDEDRKKALAGGAFTFLNKPVNIDVLAKTIRAAYIKSKAEGKPAEA